MDRRTGLIVRVIREEIRDLVAEGHLSLAADLLWELARDYDRDKENEAIILKCAISDWEKRQRMHGVLSMEEDSKRADIAYRILMISSSIRQARIHSDLSA